MAENKNGNMPLVKVEHLKKYFPVGGDFLAEIRFTSMP